MVGVGNAVLGWLFSPFTSRLGSNWSEKYPHRTYLSIFCAVDVMSVAISRAFPIYAWSRPTRKKSLFHSAGWEQTSITLFVWRRANRSSKKKKRKSRKICFFAFLAIRSLVYLRASIEFAPNSSRRQNKTNLIFSISERSLLQEIGIQPYRKVAVVEQFFDIIYSVHVGLGGRSGRHAGQKRTYRTVNILAISPPKHHAKNN